MHSDCSFTDLAQMKFLSETHRREEQDARLYKQILKYMASLSCVEWKPLEDGESENLESESLQEKRLSARFRTGQQKAAQCAFWMRMY